MIDKVKLGHLLPRLGASFDGEVVAIVLAIHMFARG
jgi:hypothetical protein